MNPKNTEEDCSGCDALGVFKQMTGGLPGKSGNTSSNTTNNNSKANPDVANKNNNNNENKKTSVSEQNGTLLSHYMNYLKLRLILLHVNSHCGSTLSNCPRESYFLY
jgi:hypothetical protein